MTSDTKSSKEYQHDQSEKCSDVLALRFTIRSLEEKVRHFEAMMKTLGVNIVYVLSPGGEALPVPSTAKGLKKCCCGTCGFYFVDIDPHKFDAWWNESIKQMMGIPVQPTTQPTTQRKLLWRCEKEWSRLSSRRFWVSLKNKVYIKEEGSGWLATVFAFECRQQNRLPIARAAFEWAERVAYNVGLY